MIIERLDLSFTVTIKDSLEPVLSGFVLSLPPMDVPDFLGSFKLFVEKDYQRTELPRDSFSVNEDSYGYSLSLDGITDLPKTGKFILQYIGVLELNRNIEFPDQGYDLEIVTVGSEFGLRYSQPTDIFSILHGDSDNEITKTENGGFVYQPYIYNIDAEEYKFDVLTCSFFPGSFTGPIAYFILNLTREFVIEFNLTEGTFEQTSEVIFPEFGVDVPEAINIGDTRTISLVDGSYLDFEADGITQTVEYSYFDYPLKSFEPIVNPIITDYTVTFSSPASIPVGAVTMFKTTLSRSGEITSLSYQDYPEFFLISDYWYETPTPSGG